VRQSGLTGLAPMSGGPHSVPMRAPLVALAVAMFGAGLEAQDTKRALVATRTLDNGLQVFVVSNSAIPFVTIEYVVRAGAFAQSGEGDEGLHHLIEHLLFRQGDAGYFDEEASKLDAASNGVTDNESVRYFLTLPSKNFAKGLDLLSSVVRKPDFSQDALKAEKEVVAGEIRRHASSPISLLYAESDRMLWEGEIRRYKSPGGNLLTVNAATTNVLKALYQRFYVPNNSAVIVSGDVTDSVAFAQVEKVFRNWKKGDDPLAKLTVPAPTPLAAARSQIVTADVNDVTFLIRWHGPGVKKDAAATFAADVFSGLVNQRVSATQKRLVDGGVVDDFSMGYETQGHVGPIEITARTSPDRAVAAAEAIAAELSKLVAPDYFTADDLLLAKKNAEVGTSFNLESGAATAHWLAALWSSAGLDYYLAYDDRIKAQTAENVRGYVGQYLVGKPMTIHVLISQENWTKVGNNLRYALREFKAP
jgi:zinc protease